MTSISWLLGFQLLWPSCSSCAGKHSCDDFLTVAATSCPEASAYSPSSSFYVLSTSSSSAVVKMGLKYRCPLQGNLEKKNRDKKFLLDVLAFDFFWDLRYKKKKLFCFLFWNQELRVMDLTQAFFSVLLLNFVKEKHLIKKLK